MILCTGDFLLYSHLTQVVKFSHVNLNDRTVWLQDHNQTMCVIITHMQAFSHRLHPLGDEL